MAERRPPIGHFLVVLATACGASDGATGLDGITTATSTSDDGTSTGSVAGTIATSSSGTSVSTGVPATTTGPGKDVGADDWDVPRYCGALDVILAVERAPFIHQEMAYDVSPKLYAAIEDRLPGWSVHYLHIVGATSTMPDQCEVPCLADGVCVSVPDLECAPLNKCDWTLGAGLVWRSYLTQCLPGPRRWVDAATEDAAALSFCMWETGAEHGPQSALTPLLEAMTPELAGPDGCNAGFLREDAYLVPIIVSTGYPIIDGDPASWAAALAAPKGGDMEAVTPVAILDPQKNAANPPGCEEGVGDKSNGYHELVDQFPVGRIGNLCEPFTPPILEVIDHIAEVCKAGEIPD